LAFELSELIGLSRQDVLESTPLETVDIFLLRLMVKPKVFCLQENSEYVLSDILLGTRHCYFSILCALHAFNSSINISLQNMDEFIGRVISRILSPEFEPEVNCEDYPIFADFLSCPAVDFERRWKTFNSKMSGAELSKLDFEALMLCLRHTNWSQNGTGFEIVKRRLPPVYFSG